MAVSVPSVPIKVFVFLHFLFTCWATSSPWLPISYTFCHLALTMFGIWVIIQPASHDANQLFLLSVVFALMNDCILIGMYFDQDSNERSSNLRFAVSFAFFNLLLKPVTVIFILVNYQDQGGFDYSNAFSSSFGNAGGQAHQDYEPVPEAK